MRFLLKTLLVGCLLIGGQTAMSQDSNELSVSEREALIMTALEALLGASPDRALPLAQKVLNGDHSNKIKSRALFVISQIDLPEAQTVLLDYAGSGDPELSEEAIRNIGISGNRENLLALKAIYDDGNQAIKEQVLEAFMIAGETQAVFDIASQAESDEEFEAAVKMLGVMGASDELRQLVRDGATTESLVQAYAISGDAEGLMELARNAAEAGNPELQVSAIRSIGVIGDDQASQALMDFYRNSDSAMVKDAALQGLMIAGDETRLLELYRNAQNVNEKRNLLRMLSITGGDAALEAIDEALEGNLL